MCVLKLSFPASRAFFFFLSSVEETHNPVMLSKMIDALRFYTEITFKDSSCAPMKLLHATV